MVLGKIDFFALKGINLVRVKSCFVHYKAIRVAFART